MSRTMPRQRPGKSEQTVETPPEFLAAVLQKLDIEEFAIDLAATRENSKGRQFVAGADPSRPATNWTRSIPIGEYAWLNPPYSDIRPWVQKAYECQRPVVVLVPASVGSNWWRDWVHEKALVLFLNGRIQFVGHTAGYPKDLALLLYGTGIEPGYDIWRWK